MTFIILIFVFISVLLFALEGIRVFGKQYSAYEDRYLSKASGALEEMFLFLPPEQVLYLTFVSIVVMALIGLFATMSTPFPVPVIVTIIGGVIGFFIPRIILNIMSKKRLEKFEHQMVDGLVVISSALKAGFSFMQAIDRLVKEMPAPISQEFGLVIRENRLGVPLDEALTHMTERVESEDLALVVTSVHVSRQVGGNLAEVFDRIAETIRERFKLEGKMKSLTSQGKMQGIIVGLLPIALGVLFYIVDPEMMRPMFTTIYGWVGLLAIAILEVIGGFLIKKIITIDV